jgi:hypothetical protein
MQNRRTAPSISTRISRRIPEHSTTFTRSATLTKRRARTRRRSEGWLFGVDARAIVVYMAEAADWAQYRWRKVSSVHDAATECTGEIKNHIYRFHAPDSAMYERCVGLAWCSQCRCWQGTMVHVARSVDLPDPLSELSSVERDRLRRSEYELVRHLDRLDRRNT